MENLGITKFYNQSMKRFFCIQFFIALLLFQFYCSNPTINEGGLDMGKKIKKIGALSDVFKAPDIIVDHSQIYIWDRFLCKVCIYSKNDLLKITEFGRKGEGPGEFSGINSAGLTDKYIYVNSYPKLCFFSKEGKFIKEMRASTDVGSFIPIGQNFIGRRHIYNPPPKKSKYLYILYDRQLRKIKEIFETEYMIEGYNFNPRRKVLWFKDCYNGVVYKNRFYIGSTDRGFYLAVFNANGDRLFDIEKDYEHIKVTNEIKTTVLKSVREVKEEGLKKYFSKIDIFFPDYFPAYINFAVDNERIYVFKYPRHKASILEVLILDLQGNLIKKSTLPASFWKGIQDNELYLYNGKLYFIDVGEDFETPQIYEASMD
jgi:hypothetical protein